MHLLLDCETVPKSDLQIATTNIARSLSQDPAKAKNISMGSRKFRLLVTCSNTLPHCSLWHMFSQIKTKADRDGRLRRNEMGKG